MLTTQVKSPKKYCRLSWSLRWSRRWLLLLLLLLIIRRSYWSYWWCWWWWWRTPRWRWYWWWWWPTLISGSYSLGSGIRSQFAWWQLLLLTVLTVSDPPFHRHFLGNYLSNLYQLFHPNDLKKWCHHLNQKQNISITISVEGSFSGVLPLPTGKVCDRAASEELGCHPSYLPSLSFQGVQCLF